MYLWAEMERRRGWMRGRKKEEQGRVEKGERMEEKGREYQGGL